MQVDISGLLRLFSLQKDPQSASQNASDVNSSVCKYIGWLQAQ